MMVANSHNLIITVRPQNDTFNLKRTMSTSSSSTTTKSPLITQNRTRSGEGLSDDDDDEHYRLPDTHIDSYLQKTPSVLKL
jgi:hypothetical protein